jgi:hypothetical protein
MANMKVTIDVLNTPELIFRVRREFAEMLRYEADTEGNPAVARRLRELAADFEVSGMWLQK